MEQKKNYTRIVNGQRNGIYKGHTLKIYKDDQSLEFHNSYYDIHICEFYNVRHDLYNISIDKQISSPKWLNNMLNQHPLKQTRIRLATDIFIDDIEYSLIYSANEYFRDLKLYSYHKKGLLFKQSYEHITLIKETSSIWSFINKRLKKLNNTAFNTFCTFSNIDQSYILPPELFNFGIKKEKRKEEEKKADSKSKKMFDDLPF